MAARKKNHHTNTHKQAMIQIANLITCYRHDYHSRHRISKLIDSEAQGTTFSHQFQTKFKLDNMAKSSRSSIFHLENISIFLGELFGTFLLVFLGCSSCLAWNGSNNVDPLRNVLSFGFAVLICVQIFGCVSGAHINPAVTGNLKKI